MEPLHINSFTDAVTARESICTAIFGQPTIPVESWAPTVSTSPIAGMPDCQRLIASSCGTAYIWDQGGTNLVVIHQGHSNAFDLGVGDLARDFWLQGYSVAACMMPPLHLHNGSIPLSCFLRHAFASIEFVGATNVWMAGLSGGGWTTVLASALDQRIRRSCSVAGSVPLYMMSTGRDWEQFLPGIMPDYNYLDLYTLAASNGRHHQINIDNDPVTGFARFNFSKSGDYRQTVATAADNLAGEYLFDWHAGSVHALGYSLRAQVMQSLTGGLAPMARIYEAVGNTTRVGNWTYWTTHGLSSDTYTHPAGTEADYCEWEIAEPGTYHIWTTWKTHTNRATNAPYRIYDGGTQLAEVRANQELTPTDLNDFGVAWKYLGKYTSANTLRVRLSADANEYVVADAILVLRGA